MTNNIYSAMQSQIIIGLTGRTGSGCSTVADILRKPSLDSLSLHSPKTRDFSDVDERKYNIIYNYMKTENRWQAFDVIELSSVIVLMVLESGLDNLIQHLKGLQEKQNETNFIIGDFKGLQDKLVGLQYLFDEVKKYSLNDIDRCSDSVKLTDYYNYYMCKITTSKNRFKEILIKHSCYENKEPRLGGREQTKLHLYTYLLQQFGNNIRSSGNPYDPTFSDANHMLYLKKVDKIIKMVGRYNQYCKNDLSTRICIDAIRNPFEAYYFHDIYRSFFLISVNTDDDDRISRLNHLSDEELRNLDNIEYPKSLKTQHELFFHQNIQECIEKSDIHIYNPNVDNNKYFLLTEQILKYIALMLHPGLVTPSDIERCMQIAYIAKVNSGCLSRQVGAVVTNSDYSIISVGWNDVPNGQVPCNLRDIYSFITDKDIETYSEYELNDQSFNSAIDTIKSAIEQSQLSGMSSPFCFKDIYNGLNNTKDNVYTRALHAEENAFLHIAKYGGQGVVNGFLFTTASPCELCAKKAYQLGIKRIYYIDPYPGISKKHILTFGTDNNPEMLLFQGAIGSSYVSLYSQRISSKDEIELMTGINSRYVLANIGKVSRIPKAADIRNISVEMELEFTTRETISSTREIEFEVLCDELKSIDKYIAWTGSSYDGTKLLDDTEHYTLEDSNDGSSPYRHKIKFNEVKKKGDIVKYKTETNLKDQEKIMQPYFSHTIICFTDKLTLRIKAPKGLIENVRLVIYADVEMRVKFSEEVVNCKESDENSEFDTYCKDIDTPNLFYMYSLEWEFIKTY